jgi:hypothetical protein
MLIHTVDCGSCAAGRDDMSRPKTVSAGTKLGTVSWQTQQDLDCCHLTALPRQVGPVAYQERVNSVLVNKCEEREKTPGRWGLALPGWLGRDAIRSLVSFRLQEAATVTSRRLYCSPKYLLALWWACRTRCATRGLGMGISVRCPPRGQPRAANRARAWIDHIKL